MGVQLLTYSRAIDVIVSADADIPNPALFTTSGTATSGISFNLRDTTKDFYALGVRPGDIIYNTTDSTAAIVVGNVDATTLDISADIFPAGGEAYSLYQGAQNDASKNGCVILTSQNTDITVITLGGDSVVFSGINGGSVLPVQVLRVTANSNGSLIALW